MVRKGEAEANEISYETSPFPQLLSWFPPPKVVFDVGANIGLYSRLYAYHFPKAKVYSFEPVKSTFKTLVANGLPNMTCCNVALSSECGEARMTNKPNDTGNRICEDGSETVTTVTGRQFCSDHDIDRVNFLKVDAEGHDLDVLRGFDLKKVDALQVEAGANRHDHTLIPYRDIEEFMWNEGFYLFRHYNQTFEFKKGVGTAIVPHDKRINILFKALPILRRMDPVFINGCFLPQEIA